MKREYHLQKTDRKKYVNQVLTAYYRKMSATTTNKLSWAFVHLKFMLILLTIKLDISKNLKSIIPSGNVMKLVDKVSRKFTNQVVGVHIRQGDATSSKNIWNEMYSLDVIDGVFEYFDKQDLHSKIFLSTDDESVLNLFLQKYSNRLFYHSKKFVKSVYDENKHGQIDAMVDLVLLSKTNKILATSPSSFSKLAVGMGDIDYVVADCIKK